jgi:hypothetical protein
MTYAIYRFSLVVIVEPFDSLQPASPSFLFLTPNKNLSIQQFLK